MPVETGGAGNFGHCIYLFFGRILQPTLNFCCCFYGCQVHEDYSNISVEIFDHIEEAIKRKLCDADILTH